MDLCVAIGILWISGVISVIVSGIEFFQKKK